MSSLEAEHFERLLEHRGPIGTITQQYQLQPLDAMGIVSAAAPRKGAPVGAACPITIRLTVSASSDLSA